MKRTFTTKAILTALLLALVVLLFGPPAIRKGYRAATSQQEFDKAIADYRYFDQAESTLSGKALQESQRKRERIYLWLLIRGRDIDGGDGDCNIFSPWKDIFLYWTS